MSEALKPHRGVLIIVFGILGLVFCMLFGVFAWIMGNQDLAEMDEGVMDPAGRQLTQAGKICGIVSVALMGLGLVMGVLLLFALIMAGAVAG